MMENDCRKKILRCILESALVYLGLLAFISILSQSILYRHTEKLFASAVLIMSASYMYKNRKRYLAICGTAEFLLLSVLLIYYFVNDGSQTSLVVDYMSFSLNAICLVTLINSLLNYKLSKQILAGLCLLPVLTVAVVSWGYYLSTGAWFASDTLLAVMQSNFNESKEYLSDYLSATGLAVGIVILLAVIKLWWTLSSLNFFREQRWLKIWVALTVLACLIVGYKTRNNLVVNIVRDARSNLQKYDAFQAMQAKRKEQVKIALQDDNAANGIFVLVIGESQNKEHMSVYGYNRKTTPWLEEVFRQDNFLKFTNAYSCHTHTVPVLTYALTAKNQYNELQLEHAISLLEAAEAAGYETAWLSNQVKYSAWDTPITVIAREANQQSWLNHNIGETTATNFYDLKLLDSINNLKITDKMLVVIHLMGNHSTYEERYPQAFEKFSGNNKGVDKYDNSILYNDYVVSQIYEQVQKLQGFKCLIYFADHAEAVEEKLGHDSGRFVWSMTHIPMYIGFSEAFRQKDAAMVNTLRNSQDKEFTNDLIFNMMLGLMNIKIQDIYEQENDITRAYYNDDIRRFKTLYGKKLVREDLQ